MEDPGHEDQVQAVLREARVVDKAQDRLHVGEPLAPAPFFQVVEGVRVDIVGVDLSFFPNPGHKMDRHPAPPRAHFPDDEPRPDAEDVHDLIRGLDGVGGLLSGLRLPIGVLNGLVARLFPQAYSFVHMEDVDESHVLHFRQGDPAPVAGRAIDEIDFLIIQGLKPIVDIR